MQDFFALMELPVSCEPDLALLESNYRRLQGQWHPDRHAGGSQAEKTAALQKTSLLNDAYATLKDPLRRAAYLLLLQGVDVTAHRQEHLDPDFLLGQMKLRDELERAVRAGDVDAIDALHATAAGHRDALWQQFRGAFQEADYERARRQFYQLQFFSRLLEELSVAGDRLLGY